MTSEELTRLDLEELQRMAEDHQTPVPECVSARMEDFACAAVLAEKGVGALTDSGTAVRDVRTCTAVFGRRSFRWLWWAVPSVALAALALFLLPSRPRQKDTFTDPVLAYVEMSRAFSMFSEALQISDQTIENE